MKRKVKISAFVTNHETRLIEITDEELQQFRDGNCGERIEQAFSDDEGEFVESYVSCVSADEWELSGDLREDCRREAENGTLVCPGAEVVE